MDHTFSGCISLQTAPELPRNIKSLSFTFDYCTSLLIAPQIPDGVEDMTGTFRDCIRLINAPQIPESVTGMEQTFFLCKSLTGEISINANPVVYTECFFDVNFNEQKLTLTGDSLILDNLMQTGIYE